MSRPVAAQWLILVLVAGCWLAGCARGPAEEQLRQDLQARLDQQFQQGLFTVTSFKRTGSAPFRDLESGVSGVYTYYDADLEFREDYSLAHWQGLNLGTLAYAIGATEYGIEGFHTHGNSRGDVLTVHGRFASREDASGSWQLLDNLAERETSQQAEPAGDSSRPSPEALVRDVRALLTNREGIRPGSRAALIVEELGQAIDQLDLRTARLEGKITLGSGTAPGTYYAFGVALGQYAEQRGGAIYSASSEGSVANASRLQAGRLDFGLVQSDVAQLLYHGRLSDGFLPYRDLRAVASLWPEAVHLLTLQGSGIERLEDLQGRRVAVGQRGSGSRFNALLIGLVSGLGRDDLPYIREVSLDTAIRQLEGGEVDAVFLTEAVPAPAVQALAARRDDLRFLSIPRQVFAQLAERQFVYYPLTVAAKTYPGQTTPFTTFGLSATLLTHSKVADEQVAFMLDLLVNGGDDLARKFFRAAFISRDTMQTGLALPLHPAAQRFYDGAATDPASSADPATMPQAQSP